jgi:hypothetical protein
LLHPEIAATRQPQDNGADSIHTTAAGEQPELNLTRGIAGSLIGDLLDARLRDDARNGVNREETRQKRIATAKEAIASKRQRFSAGLLAASLQFVVDTDVLDNVEARDRVQKDKDSEREEKILREYRSLRSKVSAIKELNKSHEQLTVTQLRVMVMWYKSKGDLRTPQTRPLLLRRLQETCGRRDPPGEPPVPSLQRAALGSEQQHEHAALMEQEEDQQQEQNEVFSELCDD